MNDKSKELEIIRDLRRRVLLEIASDDGMGIFAAEFYFDVLEFEIEHPERVKMLKESLNTLAQLESHPASSGGSK